MTHNMPGTAPGGATDLADRYGRRPGSRGRRRAGLLAAAVLVVAGLGWAGWVAFGPANAVRWQDGAFTLVDDGHATLAFELTTDPGRAAVCTVRMFNGGMTEVGRIDVTAGPSSGRTFRVVARVPTFETATSGTVRACVPAG